MKTFSDLTEEELLENGFVPISVDEVPAEIRWAAANRVYSFTEIKLTWLGKLKQFIKKIIFG